MAKLRGNNTTAVGLFVDGLDLKVAKLSIKRGNIVIEELKSTQLTIRLEEQAHAEGGAEGMPAHAAEGGDSFGAAPEGLSTEGSGDNNSMLLGMLSTYPQGKYAVSYALTEPNVYYHVFDSDFGLSGKKLKERLIEELKNVRSTAPAPDALSYFPTAEKGILCVVREDGLALYHGLEQIVPYLGKHLPRFPLIESADISLVNLARANYGFAPEEVSVIIYIGSDFTRLTFLKGSEFFHFAALISEGHDSGNIQNTVYARLLLEQDTIGIPRIDKILLAGECKAINFSEFLHEQLPEIDIQYLTTPHLDVSELTPEVQELIPAYIVPIATAWKVLDDEHPAFYPVNLLPESIWLAQRSFRIAWHGYLLIALLLASTIFFPLRFTKQLEEIAAKKKTTIQLVERVTELRQFVKSIQDSNAAIKKFKSALEVYDLLVPQASHWYNAVQHLTQSVDEVDSLWIIQLNISENGGLQMQGVALRRDRIQQIAALFENATLKIVSESGDQKGKRLTKYSFTIAVPPIPKKKL